MATLTETAYYSRNIIKFGSIGIVTFLIVRLTVIAGVSYWRKLNPPPPPPPNVLFGALPKLVFPDIDQPGLTYLLETVDGNTPDLGDRSRIYFMPVRKPNLLALDRMTEKARQLDFDNDPNELSPRRYQWSRTNPIPATLIADIVSGSFSLQVSWQQDPTILSQKNLPDQNQAVTEAQRFLQNAGLGADDLFNDNAQVSFFNADVSELVPAVSLSEADFVRVDLFRFQIEDFVVHTPDPLRGIVSLVFSGVTTKGKRVVELNYNYFPVDYESSATYPIKTSQEAFNELQEGKGYISQLDPDVTRVVIRKVSLGYYDSAVPQHYLQPIYVFEGDDNFVGYVPAININWIESEN